MIKHISLGSEATSPLANSRKAEVFLLSHPLQGHFALLQKSLCSRRVQRKLYCFHLKYAPTPLAEPRLRLQRQDLPSGSQRGLAFPWRTPLSCCNPTGMRQAFAAACCRQSPVHGAQVALASEATQETQPVPTSSMMTDGCTHAFQPTSLTPPFRSQKCSF